MPRPGRVSSGFMCEVGSCWRTLALVLAFIASMLVTCACHSAGGIQVQLDPASNTLLSQSNVSCSQSGSTFSASGTLTNMTRGLTVFASGDPTLYEKSGTEIGTKDSALEPVPPGDAYNWQVSVDVGSVSVGSCDVGFTAGPPPNLP
jgi:hypothetical protein